MKLMNDDHDDRTAQAMRSFYVNYQCNLPGNGTFFVK